MTNFSENLKRIRLDRKMSQDDFAKLLGTSKQVISRYETGQRSPKVSVVANYASVLNVPISMLTNGTPVEDEDAVLWTELESIRHDPDRRVLFKLAKTGTSKQVRQMVSLLDAMKANNPDFYNGDDPA